MLAWDPAPRVVLVVWTLRLPQEVRTPQRVVWTPRVPQLPRAAWPLRVARKLPPLPAVLQLQKAVALLVAMAVEL